MSDEWLCVQVSAAIELGTKQGSGTSPWGTYAYLTNIYCRNVPHGCGVRLKVNVCTMCKSNSPTTPLWLAVSSVLSCCLLLSCRDVLLRWLWSSSCGCACCAVGMS